MHETVQQLALGFLHLLAPGNAVALVVGLIVGMLVAVLPGLTLVMGVVLALPFTYGMSVTPSIILLTAMYLSGTYGGAFTSILFRIPGEPLDVPLLWDGYPMARQGKPAQALGWTLLAALWGGLITCVSAVVLAVPFARFALRFDSPEYFAVVLLGLVRRRRARRRVDGQGADQPLHRPPARDGGRRRYVRRRPVHVPACRSSRTASST